MNSLPMATYSPVVALPYIAIANSVPTYHALMRAAYESQKPFTNRSLMGR